MKIRIFFSLTIVSLFLTSCSIINNQPVEAQMQKVLDKGINKYDTRGVSATVVFPDKTIWTGTSGISHDTVAIKPDMLFAVGSITKNFVATLIMLLVEEEVLSLDDPLSKWLPDYPYINNNITIRQLLNHTSGIYMFWDNDEIWEELIRDRAKVWTPEEVLSYIKEPYFSPGDGFHYSNTNYLLLAMIIEKAISSKLSIEFKKRFWEPLGIRDAYLSQEEEIPAYQVHVYGDNFVFGNAESDLTFQPRASHESIGFGSSGIFTSAKSLALWAHALFEGDILQKQSLDEMLQFVEFNTVSNMKAYGLGVQLYPQIFTSGARAIGHGGGNIGTSTYMVYLPDYHISIVVMVNAYPTRSIDYITKRLIKILIRKYN